MSKKALSKPRSSLVRFFVTLIAVKRRLFPYLTVNTHRCLSMYLFAAAVCPNGWQRYLGNCYYIGNSSLGLRYEAARESCRQRESYLTTINDKDEKENFFAKM